MSVGVRCRSTEKASSKVVFSPGKVLTVIGSGVVALLLLRIPSVALRLTIAVAMITVVVFSLVRCDSDATRHSVSSVSRMTGYGLTFGLAFYGGLFSGVYVTMLTACLHLLLRPEFHSICGTTKVVNILSSLVATAIFAIRGVVDTGWDSSLDDDVHWCRLSVRRSQCVCPPPGCGESSL